MLLWDGLEEGYSKCRPHGKDNMFRKGGRFTLIKTILSKLSIFFMSLFSIPRMIRLRFKKI